MALLLIGIFIVGCVQPVSKSGTKSEVTTTKTSTATSSEVDINISEIDSLEKELDASSDIDEIDKMLKELES